MMEIGWWYTDRSKLLPGSNPPLPRWKLLLLGSKQQRRHARRKQSIGYSKLLVNQAEEPVTVLALLYGRSR
jgi:hypothetical protein